MDIGDLIMWLLLLAGSYAIARNSWHLITPYVSGLFTPPHPIIMSRSADDQPDTSTDTSTISPTARAPFPYLTDYEIVVWLAALRMADTWRYSANKIYAFVGGNRNEVMQWVRSIRGAAADSPAQPLLDDEIVTPFAGRRTRASYYPDDPTLEFEQPPR